MADITLKRGQAATIDLVVYDTDGSSPLDLSAYDDVVLVVGGTGSRHRLEIVATLDSPLTLGTGSFAVATADYAALREGPYVFEIWLRQSTERFPVRSGTLEVVDVPQPTT